MLEAGNARHRSLMEKVRKRFDFGKYKRLLDHPDGTLLNGRRVCQLKDKGFSIHMNEYAKNLKPVKLGRKLNESGTPVPLLESEMNQIRGANGSIQWLATQGRPELAAASSIIPSGFPSPTSQLVSDINHVIKTAKDLTYELRIWPIPASERRHCAFFDASYDNKGERNQLGVIIGCCSTKLNKGVEDTFSMVFGRAPSWNSRSRQHLRTTPRPMQHTRLPCT